MCSKWLYGWNAKCVGLILPEYNKNLNEHLKCKTIAIRENSLYNKIVKSIEHFLFGLEWKKNRGGGSEHTSIWYCVWMALSMSKWKCNQQVCNADSRVRHMREGCTDINHSHFSQQPATSNGNRSQRTCDIKIAHNQWIFLC